MDHNTFCKIMTRDDMRGFRFSRDDIIDNERDFFKTNPTSNLRRLDNEDKKAPKDIVVDISEYTRRER